MANLLREVAYCHAKATESYNRSDYKSGEYYENEVASMVEKAIITGIINPIQGTMLRRFGKLV